MTAKKRRGIVALLVVLIVVFTALIVSANRSPVLFRLGDGPAAFENDLASDVLNPFRNRGPEKPALEILRKVKTGHCADIALSLGVDQPDPQCKRDTELRLISWKLQAREDDSTGGSILYYEVQRDSGPGGIKWGDPYWFLVKRQADGHWKVVSLERWF
jgi:hypothetical protein